MDPPTETNQSVIAGPAPRFAEISVQETPAQTATHTVSRPCPSLSVRVVHVVHSVHFVHLPPSVSLRAPRLRGARQSTRFPSWGSSVALLISLALSSVAWAGDDAPEVTFDAQPGKVIIQIAGKPFATYVYEDPDIPRPYFCTVHAPDGVQVTRNHPPIDGEDPTDHATYHPGVWLAFGDISGADFWRNRARVEHDGFVEPPKDDVGTASFRVQNRYLTDAGQEICRETCRYTVAVRPEGHFLLVDSEFSSDSGEFVFGDQEEMGFGVRVATPISVKKAGQILNADGQKNEDDVWGRRSDWCDYSMTKDGGRTGVVLMAHPDNFRPSWFHARDYGLLLANPFGRNAFTKGPKSEIPVRQGETFRLRFGLLVYTASASDPLSYGKAAYRQYVELAGE